jgi:hypothetical protein
MAQFRSPRSWHAAERKVNWETEFNLPRPYKLKAPTKPPKRANLLGKLVDWLKGRKS